MIQELNSCNYEPTTWQAQQLEALQNILTDRYGKSNDATLEILKAAGFTPQWLRALSDSSTKMSNDEDFVTVGASSCTLNWYLDSTFFRILNYT